MKTTRKLRQAFRAKSAWKAQDRRRPPLHTPRPAHLGQPGNVPGREAAFPQNGDPSEVGPGPGHSPGLRAGPSAWRGCRGAQSGAWVRVSQCGGGCGQQWACPGPQALPEPGVLPSAAPLSPGTLRWAWGRESDVTLDRPEDSNASRPPPRAGGDGLRWRGPLRTGPCPSSADLELPQQTRPDRGLQGKPKGKRLDRGQARACPHFQQGHWSPENMSCSVMAQLGGGCPDWNWPAWHGGWPGEGKAPSAQRAGASCEGMV